MGAPRFEMRTATSIAGVVTILVALVTACGGGDDGGDAGQEAQRSIEADAQDRAEAVVLQLSDFPDGWRATPSEADEEEGEGFRECTGVDYSAFTITGEADSDDFAMGETAEALSDAAVFDSEAGATAAFEELGAGMRSESLDECLQRYLEDSADSDIEVGELELGELSFTPPSGMDDARAWQMAIPVELQSGEQAGLSATVYVDIVELRDGDTVVRVQTQDVLSPFDPELRDQLVAAVADRLSD